MNIKTITCHDVYNVGASLQAYALQTHLEALGHSVQIINYKPDYLSRHYSLRYIPNPRFRKPLVAQAYLLAKLPGRLRERFGKRKKAFDHFRTEYLKLTPLRYNSCDALVQNCPEADCYIAGSDQIWNPLLPNGHDPAFFLNFVPQGKKRISYAASFAGNSLTEEDMVRMQPWLKGLDAISVREQSGISLLEQMGLQGCQVCDPVFLLPMADWEQLAVQPKEEQYLLLYDFDSSPVVQECALELARKRGLKILSVFPCPCADQVLKGMGPREFLGAVAHASVVLSNSFHATAFSLIFHKDFYVANRAEKLNARMQDLLAAAGLSQRLISAPSDIAEGQIAWPQVDSCIRGWQETANAFLDNHLS